jgi:hypothetical protein
VRWGRGCKKPRKTLKFEKKNFLLSEKKSKIGNI